INQMIKCLLFETAVWLIVAIYRQKIKVVIIQTNRVSAYNRVIKVVDQTITQNNSRPAHSKTTTAL
ncbi:hypothetical protein, partial [Yersinia aleksiciae]|uniref:hypothetical protein n=1 Tax=Yersinia aleksiciae TaxID=263819 RepID=UPI001C93CC28